MHLGVVFACLCASWVVFTAAPRDTRAQTTPLRERLDDPPGIPARPVPGAPRASSVTFGRFTSYQVNVDSNGANIPGDAANEPSIAVNPDVPLTNVEDYLADIDMLLMMTVFPGFGGQAFIPEVLPKIQQARAMIEGRRLSTLIEVDGGIKVDNIARVVSAGGEVIVSGSGIFKTPVYGETIRQMREALGQL